jgi:hypothetical protein
MILYARLHLKNVHDFVRKVSSEKSFKVRTIQRYSTTSLVFTKHACMFFDLKQTALY